MSISFFESADNETYPIGTLLVLEGVNGNGVVREYGEDPSDSPDDIIGVSYPPSGTTGRISANADGLCFLDYDYFLYGEDLKMIEPLAPNPNWNPSFNPIMSEAPFFTLVCTHGLAPVLNSTPVIPSRWKLVRAGDMYDVYLIR